MGLGAIDWEDASLTGADRANKVPVCLFHALATLIARRPKLPELMHGFHPWDDEGLCEFKRLPGDRPWLSKRCGEPR